ncbi:YigZ family protein [Lacticaseibacillus yichunensis]|uniref:YigZ family protein n=1 Tax=Lacticaseibacillus yichunensis TaxID=2486015 RepID=A0ABW4CLC7_9LACO|nr:YigZ family protein [Lacticaseibacillus yichunensis]
MTTNDYLTIAKNGEAQQLIKKSRFICTLTRITSREEADDALAAVIKAHPKATHHVPVYLLGDQDEIQHASDDGEPSGTAGAPMLRVLQQMGVHDVSAITTRYFGGIKLGAGGLIRAYAGSVSNAVTTIGLVKRVIQQTMTLTLAYPLLGTVQHYLEEHAITQLDTAYTDQVQVTIAVDEVEIAAVQADLIELTGGQITMKLGEKLPVEVPVTLPSLH